MGGAGRDTLHPRKGYALDLYQAGQITPASYSFDGILPEPKVTLRVR